MNSSYAHPVVAIAGPSPGRGPRALAVVAGVVVLATLVGVVAGAIAPSLAPGDNVRPTVHGTVGETVSILVNNLRGLSVPLLLVAVGWSRDRLRFPGDIVVAAYVLGNTLLVGAAIGAHGSTIVPYLPQLPFEWAALTVSAAAWVAHRGGRGTWRSLRLYVLATAAFALAAAILETVAVPHA